MKLFLKRLFPRRLGRYAATLLIFALSLLLLVEVNFLFSRFSRSFSLSSDSHPLSPRAMSALSAIRENVSCTVILPRRNRFYITLHDLLFKMKDAMVPADLDLEFLDPHTDLAAATEAAGRYSISGWGVVFKSKDGRVEKVPYDALVERVEKHPDALEWSHPDPVRFHGETALITALTKLIRPSTPVVYALTGHGERDFNDYDSFKGYSDLSREIFREGYTLQPLLLGEAPVPDDCDLLFIAGPRYALSSSELASITSYMNAGGRLLLLLDRADTSPGGWVEILHNLGLRPANLTAIDQRTLGGYTVLVDRFSSHPIAHDLEKSAVYFINPQVFVIDSLISPSGAHLLTDVVAAAPDGSWGEVHPDRTPRRFDAGIDRRDGPFPIAIAVEVSNGKNIGLRRMRAFVVGDSNVGNNSLIAGGRTANRDMLLNAINWLTENRLPSAPTLSDEGGALRIANSRTRQIRYWFYSVICWPFSTALLGFFASCLRRMTA